MVGANEPNGSPSGAAEGDGGQSAPPAAAGPPRVMVWAFAAMSLGVAAVRSARTDPPVSAGVLWTWALVAAVGAGSVALAMRRRLGARRFTAGLLLLSMALVGAARYTAAMDETSRDDLVRLLEAHPEGRLVEVEGLVLDEPRTNRAPRGAMAEFFRTAPSWVLTLDVVGLTVEGGAGDAGTAPVRGRLRVRVERDGGADALRDHTGRVIRAGDFIRVQGLATPVAPARNPGGPDSRALAKADGRAGAVRVPSERLVRHLPREGRGTGARVRRGIARSLAALRSRASSLLRDALAPEAEASEDFELGEPVEEHHARAGSPDLPDAGPPGGPTPLVLEGRALVGAMLLGLDDEHLGDVGGAFTRLGLTHLVAISGVNMVLLAGLALLLVRLTGDRGMLEPLTVAALVLLYLLVLPAQAPALRGGIMVLALLLADALGRRYDRLNILALVAIALVLVRPADLFLPGFQLSFGVVGALIALHTPFHERLFGPVILGVLRPALPVGHGARFRRWGMQARRGVVRLGGLASRAFSASLLCWAVAAPIIAYHSGNFSPGAPLTTMLVAPLCALIQWVGYIALLTSTVFPSAGALAGSLLDTLGAWTAWVVHALDALPGSSVALPPLGLGLTLAGVGTVLYWVRRGRVRDWRGLVAAGVVCGWTAWTLITAGRLAPGVALRIDALGVGGVRAEACMLIRAATPDPWRKGPVFLYDCGASSSGAGERVIPEALRALGVTRVEDAVISTPSVSRFSALLDAQPVLGIRRVFVPRALVERARPAQGPNGAVLASAGPGAAACARLLNELRARGIEVIPVGQTLGEWLPLPGFESRVLGPGVSSESDHAVAYEDRSLVLSVRAAQAFQPGVIVQVVDAAPTPGLILTGRATAERVLRAVERWADAGLGPLDPVEVLEWPRAERSGASEKGEAPPLERLVDAIKPRAIVDPGRGAGAAAILAGLGRSQSTRVLRPSVDGWSWVEVRKPGRSDK